MSNKIKVYIALSLSMLCWGFTFVWFKVVNEVLPPSTIIFIRLIISSILLFFFALISRKLKPVKSKDVKLILLLSLFNPFLYFVGESYGLTQMSSTLGAVMISTIPLVTPIASRFFFNERLKASNYIGLGISFLGIILMAVNSDFSFNTTIEGFLLMSLAVLAAVGYTILLTKLSGSYSPLNLTLYQNAIGIFMFLPLVLVLDFEMLKTVILTTEVVIVLIELAVFGSSIAFILFTYGIKELGPTKANGFTNIIPVITAVIAWYILGDVLTVKIVTGIVLVVLGLFLAQSNSFFNRRG